MKYSKAFLLCIMVSVCMLLFSILGCSDKLGGAKGNVVDAFTGKPVADATVNAKTITDIENEMRYRDISAKTSSDGTFMIKGIRGKRYDFVVNKSGFSSYTGAVEIPSQSNIIIDQPIILSPLPDAGPGVYLYNGKFIKAKSIVPKVHCYGNSPSSQRIYYYNKDSLADIQPVAANYLAVNYDEQDIQMYKLFRTSDNFAIEKKIDKDEEHGNFYSTSNVFNWGIYQTYILGCGGKTTSVMRVGGIPSRFELGNVLCSGSLKIWDISSLKEGYYFVGTRIFWGHGIDVSIRSSFVFKLVK